MMKPRILDLFCGCGGISLGAKLAGFQTEIAIDIDEDLGSAFKTNFPNSRFLNSDIAGIDDSAWRFLTREAALDGIVGGPPCQGFSRIGKRDSKDPRRTLLGHYFRAVSTLQPRFFVMENVEGLLDEGNRSTLETALETVADKYHIVGPLKVSADQYGTPTRRTRVIVVGIDPERMEVRSEEDFVQPLPEGGHVTVGDAILDLPPPEKAPLSPSTFGWAKYPDNSALSEYASKMRAVPTAGLGSSEAILQLEAGKVSGCWATRHTDAVVARFEETEPGCLEPISRYPRLSLDGLCPTLRAGTGKDRGSYQAMRPIHPVDPRVITVREAARLQGFPDWFVFHPTKWHSFRMIGNSVPPPVAKGIMSVVASALGAPVESEVAST